MLIFVPFRIDTLNVLNPEEMQKIHLNAGKTDRPIASGIGRMGRVNATRNDL
jgi:hypothetical protein